MSKPRKENWVPLCEREKINTFWIMAICANQLMTNFIWVPIGVLTTPFCQKLNFSTVATTFVLLIGSIVGLLLPPFIAVWSDTTTMKFGRRRIWMICGEILVLIGLMMTSFCREISPNSNSGASAVFVIGQILASVGGNTANGPGRTMCSDVVPQSQQVLVSNICTLYAGVAGVISNLIGALKLYQYTSLKNETLVLMISCIIGCVALFVSVFSTPEEALKEKPPTVNPFKLIFQSFKFLDRHSFAVCSSFLVFQLSAGQFGCQSANYIAKYIFGGTPNDDGLYDLGISHAQLLSLVQTIVQVIFSFLNTYIVHGIGLKWTWGIGMMCSFACDIFFFFHMSKWIYIIPYMLQGAVQVIANSIPYAYITMITPSDKLAGVIAVVIFFGNMAGFVVQFGFTMGLGSVAWFKNDTGRLVGVTCVFAIAAIFLGNYGLNVSGKTGDHNKDIEDLSESSSTLSDKPEAL